MDFKIWYETILAWLNSLGLSRKIAGTEQIRENIEDVVKLVDAGSKRNVIRFIKEEFPNYLINDVSLKSLPDHDLLCICSLTLIYVCFSQNIETEEIRQKMCLNLENSVQEHIMSFLNGIMGQGDVFSITNSTVMEEILNFSQRHSIQNSGSCLATPVKYFNNQGSCNSPLSEFLQTPKRKSDKQRQSGNSYSNSDQLKKIKELTDQLVEEELEKASLQERLKWHEIKCNDYEVKLKNKMKELEDLKNEWQQEVTNNELELKTCHDTIEKNVEDRERLKKEISHFEKYVSSLEKDLSNITMEKKNLEGKLTNTLDKVFEYDEEVKRLSKINAELQEVLEKKEAELLDLKEHCIPQNHNESLMESFMDDSLNASVSIPENMGVVIERLLQERTSENETLKEAIEVIKSDKECLANEINLLKTHLAAKTTENRRLHELNKDLVSKLDGFVRTSQELKNAQEKIITFLKDFDYGKMGGMDLSGKTDFSDVSEGSHGNNTISSSDQMVMNLFNQMDSKEVHVIYDSSKELTDSASQFSFDENETHLTPIMESLNESEDGSSHSGSGTVEAEKSVFEQYQMEELNQEIITAKKSLIAFLRASMKNFEVLKIKENLINEMSKQHEHLENRITSLTELNSRLTKEILNSKNITQIDSEYREKELDNLRLEVESLKKASNLLKEKLVDLEKTNEFLVNKKEECLSELALLRERNKSLNNDLQNRVMYQLKQQNSCLGFIRNKQETEMELEKTLKIKEEIDKRFMELRNRITNHENKIFLEMMLNSAEQKFYVSSQNLLHTTYSCLKWSAKSMEHQCFLIGQSDNFPEDNASEGTLKREQEENREKLKNITKELQNLSQDLDVIESKFNDNCDMSDSLEVISSSNKTFDIINLEEKNINEKTFSITRIEPKRSEVNLAKDINATWVISPPSKTVVKVESKVVKKEKPCQGESWTIALTPPEKKSQNNILSSQKSEVLQSKSSYASALPDIEYSPISKQDLTVTSEPKTSSVTSFVSASDIVEMPEVAPVECIADATVKTVSEDLVDIKEGNLKEKNRWLITESDNSAEVMKSLEKKVGELQKQLCDTRKENERLKMQLAESEELRLKEKGNFEKRQEAAKLAITTKYENQLEHLKSEMKTLYNKELAKHKTEQSKLTFELQEKNKLYKEDVDELRNQLWDLGEKLLQEQKMKRDLERNLEEMKRKLYRVSYSTDIESRCSQDSDFVTKRERIAEENYPPSYFKKFGSSSFPTIPTEDEDEVFDNRCLEDMKAGICKIEGPEGRLTELQYRNSLCLPHLKSSYPAETQFHDPKSFRENDIKYGLPNFGHESQSLTDSDHSMTRSLLPEEKGKRKEQTSYKKPGPPTPSKNGGRLSIQGGEFHMTPKKVLRECNDSSDRKSTPGRIRSLFTTRSTKRDSIGYKDENTVPVTSRGKKLKIFSSVKPFGGRDY